MTQALTDFDQPAQSPLNAVPEYFARRDIRRKFYAIEHLQFIITAAAVQHLRDMIADEPLLADMLANDHIDGIWYYQRHPGNIAIAFQRRTVESFPDNNWTCELNKHGYFTKPD